LGKHWPPTADGERRTNDNNEATRNFFAMETTKRLLLLATLLIPACSSGATKSGDSPTSDAGDGSSVDSGPVDSGPVDSGPANSGSDDSGSEAGTPDAGKPYPAGPYGVTVGSVLAPTIEWQAYAPGATTPTTLTMTDLYDPDGTKGINAIVFDTSAQWCIACQFEAGEIPDWLSSTGSNPGGWTALGVQFVTLVIQTNSYEPATIETAEQWRSLFNLTNIYVAADPGITFPTPSLPHNLLVDPRKMTVTADLDDDNVAADDAGTAQVADPAVAQLAVQNQTK
jgi:hypothetical protein